jgi:hypothetical protein
VHQRDTRHTRGLRGDERADKIEVGHDGVGGRTVELGRDLLGPGRDPARDTRFRGDDPERPRYPAQHEPARSSRSVERMDLGRA